MAKLGPDGRSQYETVESIAGYNRWAATYDRDPNPLIKLEERTTLDLLGPVHGLHALDVGCGTGRYCLLLAERGASVVGIDPSEGMLERARAKTLGVAGIELHQRTIEEMRFPSRYFDLVLSALALDHLPVLEPTLSEMVRVLKDGGWMVISNIHPYWPVSGHDYAEFFDKDGQEYRIPEHGYLIEDYWRILTGLGMRVVDIREPRIESWLVRDIPSLAGHEGKPLAMILKARKESI